MKAACGPSKGQDVQMTVKFSSDYPRQPPQVQLHTDIPAHAHVFGSYICLDMLKSPEYNAAPYQGWTPAYTLGSVLLQVGFSSCIAMQWVSKSIS